MILGVGVDIVEAARMRAWSTNPALVRRFFGPEELAGGCGARPDEFLAARFAAKEAFGKALGRGLAGLRLIDVQLIRAAGGAPELRLSGGALDAFRRAGGVRAHVSISHDAGMALAFVVIEGGGQG
jgi:holo-[acyl-carrier protein] synthase